MDFARSPLYGGDAWRRYGGEACLFLREPGGNIERENETSLETGHRTNANTHIFGKNVKNVKPCLFFSFFLKPLSLTVFFPGKI